MYVGFFDAFSRVVEPLGVYINTHNDVHRY